MSDSTRLYEVLRRNIPLLQSCSGFERIHKGYSSDDKYIVYENEDRPTYILRTYAMDQDANKQLEFERLQMLEAQGVNCSKAIQSGVIPEQGIGYMLVSFVEGNEASEELPLLSEAKQYSIGLAAGKELKKIHQVKAPENIAPWDERMISKHQRYRMAYAECGVAIRNDEKLLAFIDDSLHLMKDRPNTFQHDDYHIGNLIIKNGELSGVIDFNRYDWGDPIHEFVKVGIFSSEVSVPFSVGQIRGYHDGSEPDEGFWRLYSLYLAMTLISSVVWILKVRPSELDDMMRKINRVMDDHINFSLIIPKWYWRQ